MGQQGARAHRDQIAARATARISCGLYGSEQPRVPAHPAEKCVDEACLHTLCNRPTKRPGAAAPGVIANEHGTYVLGVPRGGSPRGFYRMTIIGIVHGATRRISL